MTSAVVYTEDGFRQEDTYQEACKKCRGKGKFVSWSGNIVGKCFACDGIGHKTYKTDSATRAGQRAKSAAKKERTIVENCEFFAAANPTLWAWIQAKRTSFEFAAAMCEAVQKFGTLTAGQQAAIERCVAKDAGRAEERAQRIANAPEASVDRLSACFDAARAEGLTAKLKLRFDGFECKPAKETSANAGAIYVTSGETYLGKLAGGKFHKSRECSAEQQDSIIAAMQDPKAAAVLFGRKTGKCCCCGRELTDPVSVANGIGPICETNWGM